MKFIKKKLYGDKLNEVIMPSTNGIRKINIFLLIRDVNLFMKIV